MRNFDASTLTHLVCCSIATAHLRQGHREEVKDQQEMSLRQKEPFFSIFLNFITSGCPSLPPYINDFLPLHLMGDMVSTAGLADYGRGEEEQEDSREEDRNPVL